MDTQKALESSSTWIVKFQEFEEKESWLKEPIHATYQASAPPSVDVLAEESDGVAEFQRSSLKMLPTLAPLERVFLPLMSLLAQSESVYPVSMLRMLNQTGVLFVIFFSTLMWPFSTSVELFSLRKLSIRKLLLASPSWM